MMLVMESRKVKYPLGAISSVEALTFGEPGLRTFRLDIHSGQAYCSIWLEKEQLLQLGVYLNEAVSRLSQAERSKESDLREDSWSGGELTVDFKAGQMLLSHDPDSNAFYLQAFERETDELMEEDGPVADKAKEIESVGFWVTTAKAGVLGETALRICAAGRPTCFLCGQPINPEGHSCPRANGHTVLEAG